MAKKESKNSLNSSAKSKNEEDIYEYDEALLPGENYLNFIKTTSLEMGIHFYEEKQLNGKTILLLGHLPGSPVDIKKVRKQHKDFSKKLMENIFKVIDEEKHPLIVFDTILTLFKNVHGDLQWEVPLAISATKRQLSHTNSSVAPKRKDLLIKGHFKDVYKAPMKIPVDPQPVNFRSISKGLQDHIRKVYQIQKNFKLKLRKDLYRIIDLLFKGPTGIKYYQFKGSIDDLFEIAILLYNRLDESEEKISLERFTKDLALFFGRSMGRFSDHINKVKTRADRDETFLDVNLIRKNKNFIKKM